MSGILDNEMLDIECPQCKEKFRKTVGKLFMGSSLLLTLAYKEWIFVLAIFENRILM